jgi:hypothetical protein
MGNTGIALGVDGAAPFLNPATIVRLDDQRLAFSVNFYSYSLSHFSNWHQPGPVDTGQFGNVALTGTSLSSSGFGGLPSTLCLFFTLAKGSREPEAEITNLDTWRQKLAICLGTTESQGVAFSALPFTGATAIGQTSQAQSLVQSWNRIHIGPTYTIALSSRLAVGLSLHGVYTTESYLLNSSVITTSTSNGGAQSSLGIASGGSSLDLSAIVGAIYSAAPYTFGVSVTVPSIHLLGSYTGSLQSEYASGATGMATISTGSGSFSAAPPVRLAVGAGVQWPTLTLELDEALNVPPPSGFSANVSGTTSTLSGTTLTNQPFASTYAVQEHAVLNTSLGAEYFVKRDFSIVGGASINLSALPALSPTLTVGNLVQTKESVATLSAGVGNYSKSGHLLIGFQFGYGWGSSVAVNPYVTPNQLSVIDTQSYTALLILAGSTSLRSIGDAAVHMEHVITGTPMPPSKPGSSGGGSGDERQRPPEDGRRPEAPPLTPPTKPEGSPVPGRVLAPPPAAPLDETKKATPASAPPPAPADAFNQLTRAQPVVPPTDDNKKASPPPPQ